MAIWEKIISSIQDRFDRLTTDEKRRLAIVLTVGFSVLLTIAVLVSSFKEPSVEEVPGEQELLTTNAPIPVEDLFLPDEPDFLPGVLVDRERREVWTEGDALEFWQDPLRAGEEQWRDKIDAAIDEMLERVQ
jgi:hypothetical protein